MIKYRNKNWLYQKYWKENLSQTEIAYLCKTNQPTIYYWMKKNIIPTRSYSEVVKGEWKKGTYKNKKRGKDFGRGNQGHKDMKKKVIMCMRKTLCPEYEIEEEYQEGKYVYDLYIPKIDLPIEIGANKETKLNDLLKRKKIICLVLLEDRKSFSFDWISRTSSKNGRKKIMVFNWKSIKLIFITRYNLPNFKYFEELVDF